MKLRFIPPGTGFAQSAVWKCCLSALVLSGVAENIHANSILASAQMSCVPLGHGNYSYTLTLSNTPASTSVIGLFWFGWQAGEADFLASEPTHIQTPAGWSAVVEGGGDDDGYSVQFVNYTSSLATGSSVTFTFESPDSPKIMSAPASLYGQYPTLTSQVYSTHSASGLQEVFVVQLLASPLPTPTTKLSGDNLVISWQSATNVVLQQTSSLTSDAWTTIPGTLGAGSFTVTNMSTNAATFYRLKSE